MSQCSAINRPCLPMSRALCVHFTLDMGRLAGCAAFTGSLGFVPAIHHSGDGGSSQELKNSRVAHIIKRSAKAKGTEMEKGAFFSLPDSIKNLLTEEERFLLKSQVS